MYGGLLPRNLISVMQHDVKYIKSKDSFCLYVRLYSSAIQIYWEGDKQIAADTRKVELL